VAALEESRAAEGYLPPPSELADDGGLAWSRDKRRTRRYRNILRTAAAAMLFALVVAEPVIAFASPAFGKNRRRAILVMTMIDQARPGAFDGDASTRVEGRLPPLTFRRAGLHRLFSG